MRKRCLFLTTAATLTLCSVIISAQPPETSSTLPVETTTIPAPSVQTPETTSSLVPTTPIPDDTTTTTASNDPTSVTLPEGVIYQELHTTSGRLPSTTHTLLIHYTLFLTNGTKIESSRDAELPIPLNVKMGQGDFIKGVELALVGMRIGEIRRMEVPAHLAYGETGKGPVPPNTDLIFEIELVDAH